MKNYQSQIIGIFLLIAQFAQAQTVSTGMKVYQIFQQKCVSCHKNSNPQAGLNLEGAGATVQAKAADVYAKIFQKNPTNPYALAKGYKQIYAGRPDKSFLFRKINSGLEPTIQLDAQEGGSMPNNYPANLLTNEEKELVRQWILYGAPSAGTVMNDSLITDFYNNGGIKAFPNGAPAAPDASQGFQLKMGPFFIPKGGEIEYYTKHELNLPANLEVNRIEIIISNYSHHFIIYNFTGNGAASIPAGLRVDANHSNIGLVAAVQEATDLKLPQGTAFKWESTRVLDLNSHYINYSQTKTYQAEAYVNVYTQPVGTAQQEMYSTLVPNLSINIPNNGNMITANANYVSSFLGQIYLWGLMGHTHKYGKSYQIFKREANGTAGEMLYNASCGQGIPGCISPLYDYKHIPLRYFEPFYPINMAQGFVHRASWVNDGPTSVSFGPTSADEMMVMIAMFTRGLVNGNQEVEGALKDIKLYPNPVTDVAVFELPTESGNLEFSLYDATGRLLQHQSSTEPDIFRLNTSSLAQGIYFYQFMSEKGERKSGKMMVE